MSAVGSSPNSPYLPPELISYCASYLELADVGRSCRISKSWQTAIDGKEGEQLWKDLSIKEGVPIVEGERNHKEDFRFLRPITFSSKIIGRYLGQVVGDVPYMRKDLFIRLKSSPDFFEPTKLMRETHVVIVDPAALKITVGPNRPLKLDAAGALVEVPEAERAGIAKAELTVSFSFKNLRMLAVHPLKGKEKGPVFAPDSGSAVFEQCNTPPNRTGILIMRKEIVATNARFTGKQGQNAQVTNRGWKVVTVRQRGFYNAVKVLETGACSDGRNPWAYARSAESVRLQGHEFKAMIGGFAPRVGVYVTYECDLAGDSIGLVPGVSAEVPGP